MSDHEQHEAAQTTVHPYLILLDATAVPVSLGGVGRYLAELAPLLPGEGAEVVVVTRRELVGTVFTEAPGLRVIGVSDIVRRALPRMIWEQVALPRLAARLGADIIHSPHYTMPLVTRAQRVVTIHDATFFSHPEVHTRVKGAFFRWWTRRSMRHADSIVAPSIATLSEAIGATGIEPRRSAVAYHGVDRSIFREPTPDELAAFSIAHGLEGRQWIGFVGTLEPRKNVPALIDAFVAAFGETTNPPVLVLAGAAGWDERVAPAIAAVPAHLQVLTPGYLPLDDLRSLLGGAIVVAYPSLGEGFGLPVLEALSCGACVLTTNRLSLPEVGGDTVVYSEPDVDSLRASLERLVSDSALRESLRSGAAAQADKFTWASSALAHRSAYADVIGAAS